MANWVAGRVPSPMRIKLEKKRCVSLLQRKETFNKIYYIFTGMATSLRKALVMLMLLVILMEVTKPAMGKRDRWTRKKLIKKVKELEKFVRETLTCKRE